MKIEFFRDRIMGVETPIPPIMIYAAAPDGAPPRRINDCSLLKKHRTALPWLGEPLRRGTLISAIFMVPV
jgi:hypothetical protein